ncbi:hypothetical protein BPIT_11180 [Candidatus Brocadia pituitae]|nr:hypothetical protein BPIT_11180 [Candidatus Brocadia pituitae]
MTIDVLKDNIAAFMKKATIATEGKAIESTENEMNTCPRDNGEMMRNN